MLALTAITPLFSSGCLVADAPDYGPQQRTPPVIDPLSVIPNPGLFFTQTYLKKRSFSLTVHSEDAGEDLWAPLYVDYSDPKLLSWQIDYPLAASSADKAKSLSFDWGPNQLIAPGCHSLTLLVVHDSGYDFITRLPVPKKSDGDIAQVTWWMTIPKDPDDPRVPKECPSQETASSGETP